MMKVVKVSISLPKDLYDEIMKEGAKVYLKREFNKLPKRSEVIAYFLRKGLEKVREEK